MDRIIEFNKTDKHVIITLHLDEKETDCFLIDVFGVDDKDYIALYDVESEEVLLFKYNDDTLEDENINLEFIEDEEEFLTVSDIFEKEYTDEKIEEKLEEYSKEVE